MLPGWTRKTWPLLSVPISLALHYADAAHPAAIFAVGLIAIAAVADWVRKATEQVAGHTGATIGSLLNVSFGNAAELVLALFVLNQAQTRVVQAQITGSIIGTSLLGLGPAPDESNFDPEMINAGKTPVTLLKGGAIFHHNDAFLMIRGGHLDYALLGAFQVSSRGDLANWATLGDNKAPAVGGAMDLAAGAREVWALMEHVTRTGAPRILDTCTYPLTAAGVVTRIFTDLATITIDDGLIVEEMTEGVSFDYLQSVTGAPLRVR